MKSKHWEIALFSRMTFHLDNFDSAFTDSESDIDFTAERMDNLVEIGTALELDDEVLASFVEKNKAKTL